MVVQLSWLSSRAQANIQCIGTELVSVDLVMAVLELIRDTKLISMHAHGMQP